MFQSYLITFTVTLRVVSFKSGSTGLREWTRVCVKDLSVGLSLIIIVITTASSIY